MTKGTVESSPQFYARVAGFTILFYIAIGMTVAVLSSRATDAEGTRATLSLMAAHASDVRVTIVLELLECFCALILGVALYRITRDVNPEFAMLGLVCRVCESVLGAIGLRNTIGLLWLATSEALAGRPDTTDALGSFLLMPSQYAMIGAPFFALGTLAFSYLFVRGRIVPVLLAWLGVLASVLLVVGVPLQLGDFLPAAMMMYLWLPMFLFQILLGFWLLIKGAAAPMRTQPA